MTITTLVFCIGQISSAPPHLCSVDDITHPSKINPHALYPPDPQHFLNLLYYVLGIGFLLSPSAVMLDESTEPI
jgi:hypothetical protein